MRNNNKWIFVFLGVVLIAILSYLFKTQIFKHRVNNFQNDKKLKVSASFYPLYFVSSQIGGGKSTVHNITPAGAEPHDYDPSTQDIANIEKGDMLVINGGVEAWGDKIKDNLKGTNVKVVVAGNGETVKDPHAWLNPDLARQEVEKITEEYIAIDPTNANYYKNNQSNLDKKLDELDAKYKAGLVNCQSRDIITSHAAFAYLAERYGLNQVAISGLSPDEDFGAYEDDG